MEKPTIGRILLYTLSENDGCHANVVGQSRPATVVQDWSGGGYYNVVVSVDGTNDFEDGRLVHWVTSVAVSEEPEPGKMHWPKRE